MIRITLIAMCLGLTGCIGMGTNPNQIAGSYVSTLIYEDLTCEELGRELTILRKREASLTVAQKNRVNNNAATAFMWGVGHGDGVEAGQLAEVRGHITAIETVQLEKGCL